MCNILKRVVRSTSLLQKLRKLHSVTGRTGRRSLNRCHVAEDIAFEEITPDVLLVNDRKLSYLAKIIHPFYSVSDWRRPSANGR